MQKYLTSNLFSNYEVELLFKLRSRMLDVKSNFKSKFTYNNVMNLQCSIVNCYDEESQQHLLFCKPLIEKLHKNYKISNTTYRKIFSKITDQKEVILIYADLIDIRNQILTKQKQT